VSFPRRRSETFGRTPFVRVRTLKREDLIKSVSENPRGSCRAFEGVQALTETAAIPSTSSSTCIALSA